MESARKQKPVGGMLFPRGRVSSKGWVVIPKAIRDQMGLKPGDEVQFSVSVPLPNMKQDPALNVLNVIRIPEDPVALTYGMFKRKPGQRPMTELLIEERRKEAAREDRKIRAGKHRTSA